MIDVVVVSLFDGLSGGRLATDRVEHINVLRYYSSEVDKYAIQVADKNYPQDAQYRLGDVTKIDFELLLKEIREEFGNVKIMLLGGSPCQGFSMAGKLKGSSTACGIDVVEYEQYLDLKEKEFEFNGQSYLFWEYIRAMKILHPDYFLLENVRVTSKWLPMFNKAMGVEPTRINSSLVSAQNRDRYYWHNFGEILQPKEKGVLLRDILEKDTADRDKSYAVTTRIGGATKKRYLEKRMHQMALVDRICNVNPSGNGMNGNVYGTDAKSPTVTTNKGEGSKISSDFGVTYRKLTPLECERLQTLPDGYTDGVSNSQRYKMIGNGWTIDVVAHILSFIEEK